MLYGFGPFYLPSFPNTALETSNSISSVRDFLFCRMCAPEQTQIPVGIKVNYSYCQQRKTSDTATASFNSSFIPTSFSFQLTKQQQKPPRKQNPNKNFPPQKKNQDSFRERKWRPRKPSLDLLIFICSRTVRRANAMMIALKSLGNRIKRSDSDELPVNKHRVLISAG